MPRVNFTANLQRHIACPTVEADGGTVREVLDRVFAEHEKLRGYILDEQGEVRHHIVIFLNGTPILDRRGLSDAVVPADEVYVFQALSGG